MRIALLVNNKCVHDSRVIRTGEALAHWGATVVVICRAGPKLKSVERRNGVVYRRIQASNLGWMLLGANRSRPTLSGEDWLESLSREDAEKEDAPEFMRIPLIEMTRARRAVADPVLFTSPEFEAVQARVRAGEQTFRHRLRNLFLGPLIGIERTLLKGSPDRPPSGWRYGILTAQLNLVLLACRSIGAVSLAGRLIRKVGRKGVRTLYHLSFAKPSKSPLMRALAVGYARAAAPELEAFDPHIIHANELNTLGAAVAHKRNRAGHDVKVIYDSHELETGRDHLQDPKDRAAILKYEAKCLKHADAVITVSQGLSDHLAKTYDIETPTVVYNAPSVDPTSDEGPAGNALRKAVGVGSDTPLGIYVGRLKLGRGQELIIEGLKHAPGVHLAMMGPQPEQPMAELARVAELHGVADRVHFVPPVPVDQVVAMTSQANFGVVPTQNIGLSYAYAMPNKLFEMTLSGIPVIAGNLPEIARYIKSTGTGLLMDETDPVSIGAAMREAYRRRDALSLDADARASLVKAYSWQAQEQRLLDIYESLSRPVAPSLEGIGVHQNL